MNSKIIFAFCAGAAIGFAASYKFNEAKFSKIAQEEIDDVKEKFAPIRREPVQTEQETPEDNGESPICDEKIKYNELASRYNNNIEKKGGGTIMDGPYVISPDEYGDLGDYESVNLTYYEDGVLAYDIDDEVIEDIEEAVGYDAFNHFGEHDGPPDTVYVRNDARRCDYEISLSARKYSDVVDGVLDDPQDND